MRSPVCAVVVSFAAALAVVPAVARAQTGAAQVTIPLAEYDRLRQLGPQPDITVVDTVRLRGSFRGKSFSVEIVGRGLGNRPAVPLFADAEGVQIFACEGAGMVSRRESDTFLLTPLAPRFALRCLLRATSNDRLALKTTSDVLFVESLVEDGELVAGEDHAFSVVRVAAPGKQELLPSSVSARYRVTLYPEETRVRYQFEARNPNRSHQRFELALEGGEHVQEVDAQIAYEQDGARYRFELPPGESTIVLMGTMPGQELIPPVKATAQYFLLDSHPLVRAVVGEAHRRISVEESRVPALFHGAQGFLLSGRERVRWQVHPVEILPTTTFAVPSVEHVFFVATDGGVLGESSLAIDNQGASDVTIPMRAQASYASVQGAPRLLTKNADGDLWLPLATGRQQLVVQHGQSLRKAFGFAAGTVWLPQLAVPATDARITVRYPGEWLPLYESFTSESQVWLPKWGAVLLALGLLLWNERLLRLFCARRSARWMIAVLFVLLAQAEPTALTVLVLADLSVTTVWSVPWVRRTPWTRTQKLGAVAGLGLLGAAALFARVASHGDTRALADNASDGLERLAESEQYAAAELSVPEDSDDRGQLDSYQGLPARFELPTGRRRTYFFREMLAMADPSPLRLVLVSRSLLGKLTLALAALVAGLFLVRRRAFLSGWRALVVRARGPVSG